MIQLKDICDIYDCPHTTAKDEGKGYPLVRTPNVGKGRLLLNGIHRVSEDVYNSRNSRAIPEEGDLILAREAPVGNVSIIMQGQRVCLGQRVVLIKPKRELVDPHYLTYYLLSAEVQNRLKNQANGAVVAHLNVSDIRNLLVSLPELDEQIAIGKILRSIEDKIELNNRINHNLEEQAQALYKSYFVDFEPFKDGKFVDSELGLIPEGWRVAELGTVTRQSSQKVKDRIDVKVLSPVTTGELVLSEEYFTKQVFSESISKYIVVKPLHFAYNPARVNIGSIGMNMFSFDGCVSPVYVVFECEKGYHHFFDYYRKTASFKDEVLNRAIGGVRQTLSYKDFALIKLVYPPYDIVEKFNCIYARLLENKNSIKREISKLSELRDTLLPKLLSGELKINDLTC